MRITFKNYSRAGNNVRVEMFFDDRRVAEIHCTPAEFERFETGLKGGVALTSFDEVVVSEA